MKFTCHGHPHMKASHASTFEFTKEKEMTTQGTCILGVHCDFSLKEIEKLIEENDFIEGKIKIEKETVSFFSKINKDFCHQKEIVFRKSGFLSERTLGIFCDKSAHDLSRTMRKMIKNKNQNIEVELLGKKNTE